MAFGPSTFNEVLSAVPADLTIRYILRLALSLSTEAAPAAWFDK
jgi:hypothetical protein